MGGGGSSRIEEEEEGWLVEGWWVGVKMVRIGCRT